MIAAHDGAIAAMMAGRAAAPVTVQHGTWRSCRVYEITPDGLADDDDRVTSTSTAAGSSGAAASCAPRWPRAPPSGWPPGCGRSTTGCRPTTPSPPHSTTASPPTGRCSPSGRRTGSHRRRLGGRQPRRRADLARPRRGPAPARRRGADDAGRGPHRGRRLPSGQPGARSAHPRQRQAAVPAVRGRPGSHLPFLSPLNGDFAKGFRPPSSPPAPATCCCPIPCCCTGRCAGPASPPSCTSPRPPGTAVSGHGAGRPGDPARGPALRRHPLGCGGGVAAPAARHHCHPPSRLR